MFFNFQWQRRQSDAEAGAQSTEPTAAVNRIALSRAITFSGGNAAYIALLALLYQKTNSATLVGLGALASFGVPAIVSPFAGWIGDRFDRKAVMVISESLGAVCFILMALLPFPAALLLLRVAASVVAAPFVPATSAALPALVGCEMQLAKANEKLAAASIFGALIGALVAAGVLMVSSPEAVFLLNTLTFTTSAALIFSITGDFRPVPAAADERGRVGVLAAGFRYLGHHHLLRLVTLAYAIIFLGVGITGPAEVVLSTDFGAGASGFAAFTCIFAVGGIAGTRLAGRGLVSLSIEPLGLLAGASGGLAIGFLIVGFAPAFSLALAGMAVAGGAYGVWKVAHENVVQRLTPDAIRGRVFAASEAVEQAGVAVGLIFAGGLISALGAPAAFRLGAVGSLLACLLLAGRAVASSRVPKAAARRDWGTKTIIAPIHPSNPGYSPPALVNPTPAANESLPTVDPGTA